MNVRLFVNMRLFCSLNKIPKTFMLLLLHSNVWVYFDYLFIFNILNYNSTLFLPFWKITFYLSEKCRNCFWKTVLESTNVFTSLAYTYPPPLPPPPHLPVCWPSLPLFSIMFFSLLDSSSIRKEMISIQVPDFSFIMTYI